MGAALYLAGGVLDQQGSQAADRKLGILYWICIMLVLGYVVGVRIVLEGAFMRRRNLRCRGCRPQRHNTR